MAKSNEFDLFTDGACSGNPGPGGWGFILRELATNVEHKQAGAELQTTNNRMEMLSVINGLAKTPSAAKIRLVTDSQYVTKGIDEWMPNWKANDWQRRDGKKWVPVKNVELWQQLDDLLAGRDVQCEWVKGHAGHPENEECDQMAVAAYVDLLNRRD